MSDGATAERGRRTTVRARLAAAERREVIVRAAARRFAGEGYAAARLEDIAADAGVTKPVLYRHFASKKALYMSLLERHHDDLPSFFDDSDPRPAATPAAGTTSASDADPTASLRAALERWFAYVAENSHAWEMIFRDSSGDEEIRALRGAVSARARDVLAGHIASHPAARVPAVELLATAEALRCGLAGLAIFAIDHPAVERELLVEVALRLVAGALGV